MDAWTLSLLPTAFQLFVEGRYGVSSIDNVFYLRRATCRFIRKMLLRQIVMSNVDEQLILFIFELVI